MFDELAEIGQHLDLALNCLIGTKKKQDGTKQALELELLTFQYEFERDVTDADAKACAQPRSACSGTERLVRQKTRVVQEAGL